MLDKNQLKESIVYTDWGFEYLGYYNPFSENKIFFVIDSKKLNNPIINNIVQEFNLRNKFIFCIDFSDRKITQPHAYFYENTHTRYLYEKRFDLHKSNSKEIQLLLEEMYKYLFVLYLETKSKISRYIFIPSEFYAWHLPIKVNNGSIEEITYRFVYCYNIKNFRFENTFLFLPQYEVNRNLLVSRTYEDDGNIFDSPYDNFLRDEPYYDKKEHDTLTLLLKDKIPFFSNYNELEKYVYSLNNSIIPFYIERVKQNYDKFKAAPISSDVIDTLKDILLYTNDSLSVPKTRSYFPHNVNPIAYLTSISDIKNEALADIENDTFHISSSIGSTKNSRANALKYRGNTVFTSKEGFSIPGEIPVDYFNPYYKLEQYRTYEDKYEINKIKERTREAFESITTIGEKQKKNKIKDEEPKTLCDFIDILFFRKDRENK